RSILNSNRTGHASVALRSGGMGIPLGITRMSYRPRPCFDNQSRAALLFATTQSAKRHTIAWVMLRILCRSEKTPMSRTDAIATEFVPRAAGGIAKRFG